MAMSVTSEPENRNSGVGHEMPQFVDADERDAAIDRAFDYRGDVTILRRSGELVEGYLYDRRVEGECGPYVKMMLSGGGELRVDYEDISGLALTGKDAAAGKSWEAWVRQNAERGAGSEG